MTKKNPVLTWKAPVTDGKSAERYVRNGQVYIRTTEAEFLVDGKKN